MFSWENFLEITYKKNKRYNQKVYQESFLVRTHGSDSAREGEIKSSSNYDLSV